jgi:hypothetical protein
MMVFTIAFVVQLSLKMLPTSASNSAAPEMYVLLPQRKRRQQADLNALVMMQAMPM